MLFYDINIYKRIWTMKENENAGARSKREGKEMQGLAGGDL